MVVKCEMSDKAKLWLLIFAIIAIGGLAFWGVYRLAIWLKWWSLLWMVGYGFLYELINWLSDRHSGKVMKVIERNMVFLLYLIYFVVLAVSGYRLIQYNAYLLSESIDAAIIKAFLVFIAYTNMRVKGKDTEIEAKELLQRICGLFVHDR